MKESEVAEMLALGEKEKNISDMRKTMGELWKSDDNNKMAHAITLMNDALEIDPNLTELQRTKSQVGEYLSKPEMIRDGFLGIAAAADSTLLEILEAKTEAARQMLEIPPQDTDAVRKLLGEVLAEDPKNAKAKELLDQVGSTSK